jgi:hypothetical protein
MNLYEARKDLIMAIFFLASSGLYPGLVALAGFITVHFGLVNKLRFSRDACVTSY